MTDQPVLVLTSLEDTTADVVISELLERDVPVVRCDPGDLLAGGASLSAHYDKEGAATGHLRTETREVNLSMVRAVYYRRPSPYTAPACMADQDGWFAVQQARFGFGGVLASLRTARWVNHIWRTVGAEYKPHQLAMAVATGLAIPPTLVTNELDEARAFIEKHTAVVYKPLHGTELQNETGTPEVIWVRPVSPDELDARVGFTAHMFQAQLVDKTADVRTTVIGQRIFSVRISSPHIDWRENYADVTYSVVRTPPRIARACHDYLHEFELLFGAFDFGITRDGEWIFYECNTAGQWHWLEAQTGLPMTKALADLLGELP